MTLRIDRFSGKGGARIRLSGELRSEQLHDVRAEIDRGGPQVTLDLGAVDLADIDAIRFLNACEARDVEVVNCSAYIREWMFQERVNERNSEELANEKFRLASQILFGRNRYDSGSSSASAERGDRSTDRPASASVSYGTKQG